MKKYICLIGTLSSYQISQVRNILNAQNLSWWTWVSGSILIVDSQGLTSANQIRDIFKNLKIDPVLIFDIPNKPFWAGYGPSSDTNDQKNMFKWLNDVWDK